MSTGFLLPVNGVSLIRGVSKTLELAVTDQAGAPVDLTGARVVFSIKKTIRDELPIVNKSSDDVTQIYIGIPTSGKAQIYVTPADTHNLDITQYVFDVWVVLSNGKRYAVVPPSILDIQAGVTVIPL